MEKIVLLGISIILLGTLLFDYLKYHSKQSAVLFLLCFSLLLLFYLLRFNQFDAIQSTESNKQAVTVFNLLMTLVLASCAVYTVSISHKTTKIASEDFKYRMKPQIVSKLHKIETVKDRLIVTCVLQNKGLSEISIDNVQVKIINLERFKEFKVTEIIKSVDINVDVFYLPPDSDLRYNFDMAEDNLKLFEENNYALLIIIKYFDYNKDIHNYNWLLYYNNNPELDIREFATYAVWTD